MIVITMSAKKAIVGLGIVILVLISAMVGAAGIMFTDCPAMKLKVLGVDVYAQTVVFEAPDGVVANLTLGDIVGQEQAEIKEIRKLWIILERTQEGSMNKSILRIPAVRVSSPVLPIRK